jgi:hypothetical protein
MHSLQVYFIVCYFVNFFTFYKFNLFTHLLLHVYFKRALILLFSFNSLCLHNKLYY